jgi:hypothetical protein
VLKYAAILGITLDEREFAVLTGFRFDGLSIGEKDGAWKVTIKARDWDGRPFYAVTVCTEVPEGLAALLGALAGRDGHGVWREDKYRT